MYKDFVPDEHRGMPLYELVTVEGTTLAVPSEVTFEQASEMPWNFLVEVDDDAQDD